MLHPALANKENSIGEVMYQIVGSLHGYKLNNPVDLSRVLLRAAVKTEENLLNYHLKYKLFCYQFIMYNYTTFFLG